MDLDLAISVLQKGLAGCFHIGSPTVKASWPLSGRTVSEIGGRLIEDYVLGCLKDSLESVRGPMMCEVRIPESGRAIEDIAVVFDDSESRLELLVDIKGHNQLRKGSRPNLASIRKCIEFYGDPKRVNSEIIIFYCRYEPSIPPGEHGSEIEYSVLPESFSDKGVFPLRYLSNRNLDPANIGSGGQLLLAREAEINFSIRSRSDFLKRLLQYRARLNSRGT
jgi:hypothetical protein